MAIETGQTRSLQIRRTFEDPWKKIFEAWTSAEALKRFREGAFDSLERYVMDRTEEENDS